MKMIKGALFVFIGLFIFMTLISLLIPSRIVTVRATTVQQDSLKLFEEISNLNNWKHWHPVFLQDSNNIKFYGEGSHVNDFAEWVTNGKKNTLIIYEKKYPSVKILLKREGENDMENTLSVRTVQEQGNLQVQWMAVTKLKWYPWEKFSGIFIEKMAGSGYETALASLKTYVENKK